MSLIAASLPSVKDAATGLAFVVFPALFLFGFGVHAVQGRAVTMPVSTDDLLAWLSTRSV